MFQNGWFLDLHTYKAERFLHELTFLHHKLMQIAVEICRFGACTFELRKKLCVYFALLLSPLSRNRFHVNFKVLQQASWMSFKTVMLLLCNPDKLITKVLLFLQNFTPSKNNCIRKKQILNYFKVKQYLKLNNTKSFWHLRFLDIITCYRFGLTQRNCMILLVHLKVLHINKKLIKLFYTNC